MLIEEVRSAHQLIQLVQDPLLGLTLLMDGTVQFTEYDEHRYHECLAAAPMLFCDARRVFIGGGGDGLAAARLLRFPSVEAIVVCDYDPEITRLAREQPDLLRLNGGALNDPRVTVVNEDAPQFLSDDAERYDLVICDFPDPFFPELNQLYSLEHYRLVRSRLTEGGLVCVQTRPTPACAPIIWATLGAVFAHTAYYRTDRNHSFTLASEASIARTGAAVPAWTRHLSEPLVEAMFVLPKDDAAAMSPAGVEPNRAWGGRLVAAALAEHVGPAMVDPCPHRPGAKLVWLSDGQGGVTDAQIRLIVREVASRGPVVLLVGDEAATRYADLLDELGSKPTGRTCDRFAYGYTDEAEALADAIDSSAVASLDACTTSLADLPEIDALVARWSGFLAPGSALDRGRRRRWVVARDPEGAATAVFAVRVVRGEAALDLAAAATPELLVPALSRLLAHLEDRRAEVVTALVADEATAEALRALGAAHLERYRVYA